MTAYRELEEDVDNIRAAWHWAIAQGRFAALDKQAQTLMFFFETRSRYQEGLDSFARAFEALGRRSHTDEHKPALGRLLIGQSHFATRLGQYADAKALLKEGDSVFRELDNRQELADSLTRLGGRRILPGELRAGGRGAAREPAHPQRVRRALTPGMVLVLVGSRQLCDGPL